MGVESSVRLAGGKGCKSSSRRHLPVNTTLKPAGPVPGLSRPGTVSARQGGRGDNARSLFPAGAGDRGPLILPTCLYSFPVLSLVSAFGG